jgi:hypothetical protein
MGHIPTTANRVIALISPKYRRAIQWGCLWSMSRTSWFATS